MSYRGRPRRSPEFASQVSLLRAQCTITGSACRKRQFEQRVSRPHFGRKRRLAQLQVRNVQPLRGVGQPLLDAADDVVEAQGIGVGQQRCHLPPAHRAGHIGPAQLSLARPPAAAPSSRTAHGRRRESATGANRTVALARALPEFASGTAARPPRSDREWPWSRQTT